MHDYKTPGTYYCSQDVIAKTLSNYPLNVAFSLRITTTSQGGEEWYILQEYIAYDGRAIYFVGFNVLANTWTKYHAVNFSS